MTHRVYPLYSAFISDENIAHKISQTAARMLRVFVIGRDAVFFRGYLVNHLHSFVLQQS